MRLFIAEKPSLGREIASVLGIAKQDRTHILCRNGDVITWCYGHMYQLLNPEDYSENLKQWSMDTLPILPAQHRRRAIPKVKPQITVIKNFLKQASSVVHGGDPDREGSLLVDELLEELNWKGKTERIWLTALNEKAIRKALDSLAPNSNYRGLTNAAYARSVADWIVGMNLTRAFTIKAQLAGNRGVYSVGRVQSPTLKLVVDRDRLIQNFKPVPHYVVDAIFTSRAGNYTGRWVIPEHLADTDGRCLDKASADKIAAETSGKDGFVKNVEKKKTSKKAELPFNLSALQTYCSKKWGLSAQQVLDIAQALYERHKATTYPRTDCRYLAEGAFSEARETLIGVLQGEPELKVAMSRIDLSKIPACYNEKKITAHTAIIPTTTAADLSAMNELERKVFDAIKRRFVAQFLPPYVYETTTILTHCQGSDFKSQTNVIVDPGWRAIQDDEPKDKENTLTGINQGMPVRCSEAASELKHTSPPPYYTEGSLIADMENISKYVQDSDAKKLLRSDEVKGIGTEATRAAIIENLKAKDYLTAVKKTLRSTPKGQEIIDILPSRLTDPATTAEWESVLKMMAEKNGSPNKFIAGISAVVGQEVTKIKNGEGPNFTENQNAVKCPKCDKPMARRKGQNGYFWGCTGYPECKTAFPDKKGKPDFDAQKKAAKTSTEHNCTACQKPLIKRQGENGPFWGCSGYPKCKQTYPDQSGKPNMEKAPSTTSEHVCPECKKPMIRRPGKKKKNFWWGCSGYPKCTVTCFDQDGKPVVKN